MICFNNTWYATTSRPVPLTTVPLVRMFGIEGNYSGCNGLYMSTGERLNGKPVFQHASNKNLWLRLAANQMWVVSRT